MSSTSLTEDEEAGLQFEIISQDEIRKRARAPQSSGLSSSLAQSISRSTSLPSTSSTPTSTRQDSRASDPQSVRQMYKQDSISEEAVEEEDVSPSFRPIVRRARQQTPDIADALLLGTSEGNAFVPPHLMSFSGQQTMPEGYTRPGSLFEGVGRKLRGMDAVRFRRSVMQQTGFLESSAESLAT